MDLIELIAIIVIFVLAIVYSVGLWVSKDIYLENFYKYATIILIIIIIILAILSIYIRGIIVE